MTKFGRIKDSELFNRFYTKSKSYHSDTLILMYMQSSERLVGFAVSKKISRAVDRNRIKRRLRAIFRERQSTLKAGLYLLVAKYSALEADFKKLSLDANRVLSHFFE